MEGAHGGNEADSLVGGALFFEIGGEVGGVFKYNHFMLFEPQNGV